MKRNISFDKENTSQRLLEYDGSIAGMKESSTHSSGVYSDPTVLGAG